MAAQQIGVQHSQNASPLHSGQAGEGIATSYGIIRAAADSRPSAVAGAIARQIREKRQCEVQAIGMGAINQMIKAVVIARSYLVADQLDLNMAPSFVEVLVAEEVHTALRLSVWAYSYDSSQPHSPVDVEIA
jgi:stage V sporulation protein S